MWLWKGNLLLRAFQVEGYSKNGNPSGWKLFRVDKISHLRRNFQCLQEGL